jgi:hypothetical protein
MFWAAIRCTTKAVPQMMATRNRLRSARKRGERAGMMDDIVNEDLTFHGNDIKWDLTGHLSRYYSLDELPNLFYLINDK